MLTTFENADRQNRRRMHRDRHLKNIDDILRSTSELTMPPTSNADLEQATTVGYAADMVSGAPRAPTSSSGNGNHTTQQHSPPRQFYYDWPTDESPTASPSRHRRRNNRVFEITSGRFRRHKMLSCNCLASLIVALVVIVVVAAGRRARLARARHEAMLLERFENLSTLVVDWGVTNETVLQEEKSSTAKALRWLAFEDYETVDEDNMRTRFALATLYYSTFRNVSAWNSSSLWLSKYPVCLWHGVGCEDDEGDPKAQVVQSLNLSSNNLYGTLPVELGLLDESLVDLDVSYNSIWGSIPGEIGSMLINLQRAYLCPNRLDRTIPESLFTLTHLTHLYMDRCQLSGTLPDSIGVLSNLEGLAIHDNYLSGTIPSAIGQLTKLRVLNLDTNAVNGTIPSSIGNLTGLVDLRLDDNHLRGTVPTELSNLHTLEVLYLSKNQLTGPLGAIRFEMMPLLGDIQLQKNFLNGTIPESLGSLALLQVLYLDHNQLEGSIPEKLGNALFLNSLYLSENKLNGTIPTEIGKLHRLVNFWVHENNLQGPLPSELGNVEDLELLFLNNNTYLNGAVPPQLGALSNLHAARFHGNDLTGAVPLSWCDNSTAPFLTDLTADCERENIECLCCTCYV